MDTIFTLLVNAGQRAGHPRRRRRMPRGRPRSRSRTSPTRTRTHRRRRSTTSAMPTSATHDGEPCDRATGEHRSSSSTTSRAARCTSARRPTSAPTCCCGSTTAPRDASWCGGCMPLVEPGRASADRGPDAWITVAFTYQGLKALGVPQDVAGQLRPRVPGRGWRPARPSSATSATSSPEHWEKPLGTPRRARRPGRALPRRRAPRGGGRSRRAAPSEELRASR